ncbi:adenylyltransferase/cytidyltransferase family protein [Gaoshiqia sediminis]|uniref:Adenylyltransferase/cytidyltransferase family protein n=1 Tax=Gaoshiqia sediminis TaxID=2986998 RepID=A0AA41YCZ4_9BACT|nr:adenylyltransferase/cytidyltransferase family protein [Gaoshiqia sediminis]MCW0484373.1 adenylyltransferase/cytidyltransferase family protein [Gaoshiqia sediminis]
MKKKVFVSGCFDMLHSGHVAFFREAATHGDLYVGLGSDKTIFNLKGRKTINTDAERLYMVRAIRYVTDAWINSGSGLMDFEQEVRQLKPDIFFVNEDGYTPDKQKLCAEIGIELLVSKREPHQGLPVRSTTALRSECRIPFRLDLAGGWLDQPFVSQHHPGPVITISIEPDYDFNDRSGMSSSTRKKAIQLWKTDIPEGDTELLAKTLFSFENPPGTKYVSGSQDAIGIVFPGVNKLDYEPGQYWPSAITAQSNKEVLDFIERHLWFITLSPRNGSYDVLADTAINAENAKALADAALGCWDAILQKNLNAFGHYFRKSFEAQIQLFPNMVNEQINEQIEQYRDTALGWKLSGAGGGGYLVLVSDKPIPNAIQVRIRR